MVTRDQAFPSRFYKAADLPPEGKVVTIAKLVFEMIGADRKQKCVGYFYHDEKQFVVNPTNWDSIAAIAGPDSDDWVGIQIVIYPTTTQFGGKVTDCIRVRRPRSTPAPAQPKTAPPPIEAGSHTTPPDEEGDPGYQDYDYRG
jgi:hypothetical protein